MTLKPEDYDKVFSQYVEKLHQEIIDEYLHSEVFDTLESSGSVKEALKLLNNIKNKHKPSPETINRLIKCVVDKYSSDFKSKKATLSSWIATQYFIIGLLYALGEINELPYLLVGDSEEFKSEKLEIFGENKK